ncbi:MAG: Bax inhibitor-1/YccA family protein [Bacteroidales bacterium]|nr:Bax inhibitor-1/YccA family protein [Bacteroidales bacterium]
MNFERTSNPAFSDSRFAQAVREFAGEGQMTVQGTATKTLLLFALVVLTATITWKLFGVESPALTPCMIGGGIGAFVCALVCCFKQDLAMIFGPIYALCEGLLLGAVSAMYNAAFHGIVLQAVLLTSLLAAVVFICYRFGILRASNTFVKVITYATIGIGVFYLVSFVANLFGANISLFGLGWVGVVIQLIIVGIASLNLVLDFNTIENGVESGAPAEFEWYAAFGLMVTLVWIYLEILRLLAMILGSKKD